MLRRSVAVAALLVLARGGEADPGTASSDAGAAPGTTRRFGEQRWNHPLHIDDPLALAVADLDSDGRDEVIVLGAREVLVAQIDSGGVTERAHAALEQPLAEVRSRTRVGALLVADLPEGRRVLARTSDGAGGARFVWDSGALVRKGMIANYPLAAAGGRIVVGDLTLGRDWFEPRQVFSLPTDNGPAAPAPLPEQFYTLSARAIGGVTWWGAAGVDGILHIYRGSIGQGELQVPNVGYAFALFDADGDGAPEVATSEASLPGAPDAITVRKVRGGPALIKVPTKGGVVALAAGRITASGAPGLVALTRRGTKVECWVIE